MMLYLLYDMYGASNVIYMYDVLGLFLILYEKYNLKNSIWIIAFDIRFFFSKQEYILFFYYLLIMNINTKKSYCLHVCIPVLCILKYFD